MHDEEHLGEHPQFAQVMKGHGPGDGTWTFGEESSASGEGAASALEKVGTFAAAKEGRRPVRDSLATPQGQAQSQERSGPYHGRHRGLARKR